MMSMNDDDPSDDSDIAIERRLAELREEHKDLDDAIQALEERYQPDMLQIARLKKKKLVLKDEIIRLEDQLTPDIIA
ncbi:DUF465 domain-containing protein [Caulobacter segnis]|uniref:YdcH family protein n=1 Tax=Caulobacter segnis TaxID=88688 RepID=UPI00286C1CA8|nr:DUF465 domain-containing protein [Caulobacter segnis]